MRCVASWPCWPRPTGAPVAAGTGAAGASAVRPLADSLWSAESAVAAQQPDPRQCGPTPHRAEPMDGAHGPDSGRPVARPRSSVYHPTGAAAAAGRRPSQSPGRWGDGPERTGSRRVRGRTRVRPQPGLARRALAAAASNSPGWAWLREPPQHAERSMRTSSPTTSSTSPSSHSSFC